MINSLLELPVARKIEVLEQLWDSIAEKQESLPITEEQRVELDKRLNTYKTDGIKGRIADNVLMDIRKQL